MNVAVTWGLSNTELSIELERIYAQEQRLGFRRLDLIREVDARGLAIREGAPSTAAWLSDKLRISVRSARLMVELARAMDTGVPATSEALQAGAINQEQAAIIARTVAALAGYATLEVMAKAEQRLVGDAAYFEPRSLRLLADRIVEHVAPQIADAKPRKARQHRRSKRIARAR